MRTKRQMKNKKMSQMPISSINKNNKFNKYSLDILQMKYPQPFKKIHQSYIKPTQNRSNDSYDRVNTNMSISNKQNTNQLQKLKDENAKLRKSLKKIKAQMFLSFTSKQKIEEGLKQQVSQMKEVLDQYLTFIDKLLNDKKVLLERNKQIQVRQEQLISKINKVHSHQQTQSEMNQVLVKYQQIISICQQKQTQIERLKKVQQVSFLKKMDSLSSGNTKNQKQNYQSFGIGSNINDVSVQQFFGISKLKQQLQKDNKLEFQFELCKRRRQLQARQHRIVQLQDKYDRSVKQIERLKKLVGKNDQQFRECKYCEQIKQYYQNLIEQIQKKNEQQFLQYQKAVNETLLKKDDCIKRLNLYIQQIK